MSHAELVSRAGRWLRSQGCNIVLSEFCASTGTGEQPDCIGWRGGTSILIECKSSRSDFLADKRKSFRQANGMGDFRLFLAPPGVIALADVPEGWGLLIAQPNQIAIAGEFPRKYTVESWGKKRRVVGWYQPPFEGNKRAENAMLLSAMRRVQMHHGVQEFDRLAHLTYAEKVREPAGAPA